MKTRASICLLLCLCGCASRKPTQIDDTSKLSARLESPYAGFFGTNGFPFSPTTPQVKTAQKSLRASALVVEPQPTNNFILLPTFLFSVPSDSLTNGVLQSSTDLVTWHDRPDCYQEQTSWLVPTLPGDTCEFYRAKFEVTSMPAAVSGGQAGQAWIPETEPQCFFRIVNWDADTDEKSSL